MVFKNAWTNFLSSPPNFDICLLFENLIHDGIWVVILHG